LAAEKYCCGNPVCCRCENKAECGQIHDHLYSN
jgi:hypothetical protein